MARVVQQRTGPPYLLIIMVFLFLIAATLFVLTYMKADKLTKQLADTEETLEKLAGSDDLRDAKIDRMMSQYDTPPAGEVSKTVVKQFQSQVNDLTRFITGQSKDVVATIAEIEAARTKIKTQRGLVPELLDLDSQREQLTERVKEKDKLIAQREREIQSKDQTIESISTDLSGQIGVLLTKVQELDNKFSQRHATYQRDLELARQGWSKDRDDLNKQISGRIRTIQELQKKILVLNNRTKALQQQLQELRPKADSMQVALKADGKVMQVTGQGKICYINIGEKDRVTTGLTFSVYPPTGVTKDGEGKGKIRVTTVGPNTSECHVQEQSKDDPISPDDLVANIAFDSTQVYTFVVEGEFDLYGTGRTTPEGTKDAKALIRRYGGRVIDQIGMDTDFIVIGSEPRRPPKPAETASGQEWQAYREQLKVYDRFNEIKLLAESRQIPILNPNKFLAFIGYAPTKADR